MKSAHSRAVAKKFPRTSKKQLSVECYSVASFRNLTNGGSQGGYINSISDHDCTWCPIAWQSRRVRMDLKSTIAAETLALLDAAEVGIYYSVRLMQVMGIPERDITVGCFVDNRSIAGEVHSTTAVETSCCGSMLLFCVTSCNHDDWPAWNACYPRSN